MSFPYSPLSFYSKKCLCITLASFNYLQPLSSYRTLSVTITKIKIKLKTNLLNSIYNICSVIQLFCKQHCHCVFVHLDPPVGCVRDTCRMQRISMGLSRIWQSPLLNKRATHAGGGEEGYSIAVSPLLFSCSL